MTRRGSTLVELLLVMVMLALFAAVLTLVVRTTGRVAARALLHLEVARTSLALRSFVIAELHDASSDAVHLLSSSKVAMPRQIGEALPCSDDGSAVHVALADWVGTRTPEPGRDSMQLLLDLTTQQWQRVAISALSTDPCPDGRAAWRIDIDAHAGTSVAIRVIEPVELSSYLSNANDWFGLTPASHSSPVQPFSGPLLVGANQFTIDSTGLHAFFAPPVGQSQSLLIPIGVP